MPVLRDGVSQCRLSRDGEHDREENGADVHLLPDSGGDRSRRRPERETRLSLGRLAGAHEFQRHPAVRESRLVLLPYSADGQAVRGDRGIEIRRTGGADHGAGGESLSEMALSLLQRHLRRLSARRGGGRIGQTPAGRAIPGRNHRHRLPRPALERGLRGAEQRFLGSRPLRVQRQRRLLHPRHDRCLRPDSRGKARRRFSGALSGNEPSDRRRPDPGRVRRCGELGRDQQQVRTGPGIERRGRHPFPSAGERPARPRGFRAAHEQEFSFRRILRGNPFVFGDAPEPHAGYPGNPFRLFRSARCHPEERSGFQGFRSVRQCRKI